MKMKCLLTTVFVLTTIGLLVSSGHGRIDEESILGVWLFEDDKGGIAKDSSGNGFDGEIVNGPELVEGKFGKALEFDGIDDHVDFGNDEALKPQELTIMAWFSTRKLTGYGHIFQSGHDWNDMAGIVFRVHQNGTFNAGVTQGAGNAVSWVSGPNLSDETWYHAALTYDDTSAILYLDGVEVGRGGGGKVLYDDTSVRIGSHTDQLVSLFDGFIDEVAYFNEALAPKDIQLLMEEGLEHGLEISIAVSTAGKLATTWGHVRSMQ